MNPQQAAVVVITHLLADKEYGAIEAMTHGRRLSAADLEAAVTDYGRTIIELPTEAVDKLDLVQVEGAEPTTYHVVVDLWTAEEGRSDLTLELHLIDRFSGAYDTEVLNLHTL